MEAETLHLRWQEQGGPAVDGPPDRAGFGTRVLEGTARGQLRGSIALHWLATGLVCTLTVPLHATPPDEDGDAVAAARGDMTGRIRPAS